MQIVPYHHWWLLWLLLVAGPVEQWCSPRVIVQWPWFRFDTHVDTKMVPGRVWIGILAPSFEQKLLLWLGFPEHVARKSIAFVSLASWNRASRKCCKDAKRAYSYHTKAKARALSILTFPVLLLILHIFCLRVLESSGWSPPLNLTNEGTKLQW